MGSQEIQNKLWGRQTEDWANIQEQTGNSGYEYALSQLDLNEQINLLDAGCGFNSFQYAGDIKTAFTEAKRVLRDNGKIVVMIWGNKEDCEVASYLKAVGSLMPPPPPGAGGPFAFSENQLLERLLKEAGFKVTDSHDVDSVWEYPDKQTALKGLASSGPITKVIEHSSSEEVEKTILKAIEPYVRPNGSVVYNNKWRVVTATK